MEHSGNPDKQQAGRDILNAQANDNLEYIGVKSGYDASNPSANPKDPKQIFP
jgi:hypothetical protein